MGSLPKEKFSPRFIRKPQLRQEDDGNRLIFECELAGNPKPNITWYRSDEVIDEDDRTLIKIEEIKSNVFSVVLELNDVIESDAGLYKVKAKNSYGEVAASINLNFSPLDAPPLPQIDGTAPTFSEKPTIQQDANGKTLIFHCAIIADPTPTITWYHNGVKVQDDVKFQIVNKVGNEFTVDCSLLLKDVTVEDAGKYKVTARNDLGESNATISLNFDSDEAPIPLGSVKPTFTERPVIRQTDDESKIIFECRLVGDPKPEVVW
uniref:Projectin [Tribolium castaneum] n=4 Tax=Lepeophtheirus salmonis TaxID=72036 RepID=A0A0K2VBF3_LEPSM